MYFKGATLDFPITKQQWIRPVASIIIIIIIIIIIAVSKHDGMWV